MIWASESSAVWFGVCGVQGGFPTNLKAGYTTAMLGNCKRLWTAWQQALSSRTMPPLTQLVERSESIAHTRFFFMVRDVSKFITRLQIKEIMKLWTTRRRTVVRGVIPIHIMIQYWNRFTIASTSPTALLWSHCWPSKRLIATLLLAQSRSTLKVPSLTDFNLVLSITNFELIVTQN